MEIRTDLLKFIVKEKSPKRYLEIGIQAGQNFNAIDVPFKVGVEPFPRQEQKGVLKMYSDDFFKLDNPVYDGFDLIFIDGLHTEEQTWIDLQNSLERLNEGGIIVMHDALPHNLEYTSMNWCGTSYKAIMRAAQTPGLVVKTWEKDHGCAVISVDKGSTILEANAITTSFEDLWKNNASIVNKSTTEEIIEHIKSL